jgi:hypothetical protein
MFFPDMLYALVDHGARALTFLARFLVVCEHNPTTAHGAASPFGDG